jgi:phosphoglycolate phosphatase
MSKKYHSIIWDWNGTLIDDSWLAIEVMNDMLFRRSLKPIDLNIYRDLFDFPVKDYYKKIGFDFYKESFEIVGAEFIELYDLRHFELNLRLDALKCLSRFSSENKTQYVLSARNQKQLAEEMEYYEILSHFKTFAGLPDNHARGKIGIGQQLIENENILTEQTVIIGDTTHDFEVASSLGIDCILIEDGHHSSRRLKNCGVTVLKNLDELCQFDL